MKNPYTAAKNSTKLTAAITDASVDKSSGNSNVVPGNSSSKKRPPQEQGALTAVEIGATASFSQAFSSVEDTTHFRSELSKLGDGKPGSSEAASESWAQQRAFDEATAAQSDASGLNTARDHHTLLQQPHVLYVSTKQRGNGLLKFVRNVPFQFATMVPDYILHTSQCALFLSCKYHSLYPDYIHRRIAELKTDFVLRILLVLVDVEDNVNTLLQLNRLAVQHNMTLILSWTEEEAARYLETFKALDGKDASSIQKREQTNFADQVADVLVTAKSVNKTDAAQLLSQFGSLKAVVAASVDELCTCPGVGPMKVRGLYEAFRKPFSSRQAKRRREEKRKQEDEARAEEPAGTTVVAQELGDVPQEITNVEANDETIVKPAEKALPETTIEKM